VGHPPYVPVLMASAVSTRLSPKSATCAPAAPRAQRLRARAAPPAPRAGTDPARQRAAAVAVPRCVRARGPSGAQCRSGPARVCASADGQGARLGNEAARVPVGGGEQDVAARQVAVQDVQLVQVRERAGDLARRLPARPRRAARPSAAAQLAPRARMPKAWPGRARRPGAPALCLPYSRPVRSQGKARRHANACQACLAP